MSYWKFFATIILFSFFISCQKEEAVIALELRTPLDVEFRSSSNSGATSSNPQAIMYSMTELIVQYGPSVSEAGKNNIRNQFQVLAYEVCAHCDGTIEKWDFGPGGDIEHKYATAKEKEAEAEGMFMVDREFDFFAETPPPTLSGGTGEMDYSARIVAANSGVTIAVLDSGVDPNYPSFTGAFLYRNESEVTEIQSGWDYVEEDNNCYDDNEEVHGTAVASIINNYLSDHGVPHQILPIKVANAAGTVSLFDAYCGISYAASVSDIIQMSFGWYDDGEDEDAFTNDIFGSLIEKYKNQVLFVTSAGNSGGNNDAIFHYPSNYDKKNNIAIAAANEMLDDLAGFSNFGALSVDFVSLGTAIPFVNSTGEEVPIFGTSFSAPQVTAIAARQLYLFGMNLTPIEIVSRLQLIGTPISPTKPTVYDKILLP